MKILLPFYDDSSLFFAAHMAEYLNKENIKSFTYQLRNGRDHDRISSRQISSVLAEGPDYIASEYALQRDFVSNFAAVISCKVTEELRCLTKDAEYMSNNDRPSFVAFQPGLEFTPSKGIKNRENFDIVFLNNKNDYEAYHRNFTRKDQIVSWGHPYFLAPKRFLEDQKRDIYFFAQAISPKTYRARNHIAEIICAIAEANPNRKIIIKLRNLPNENLNHVHKEEYNYNQLFEEISHVPENIGFTSCSMKEALENASIVFTCTSTAAMDAISEGIPTMVYTDYIENYKDPMAKAMERIFKNSGVLVPLNSLLHLEYRRPRKLWIEKHFRGPELFKELIRLIGDREVKRGVKKVQN